MAGPLIRWGGQKTNSSYWAMNCPCPITLIFRDLLLFLHHMWHQEKGVFKTPTKSLRAYRCKATICTLSIIWVMNSTITRPQNLGSGVLMQLSPLKTGTQNRHYQIRVRRKNWPKILVCWSNICTRWLRQVPSLILKVGVHTGGTAADQQILFGGHQVYYNTDGYEKPLSAPNIPTLFIPTIRALPAGFAKRLTITRLTASISSRDNALERTQYFRLQTAEWERLGRELENQS